MGKVELIVFMHVIDGFFTTPMGTLAKISGNALRSGLLAVIAAIKIPVLRFATTDRELTLSLILHAFLPT